MKNFKILGFVCLAILINNKTHAQEKGTKADDIKSIKKMCGCFEVSFNFAETYSENENYEFYDRYSAKAPAEWATIVGEDETRIQIQHILVVGETMTVKHWRQDWVYQSPYRYDYIKDQKWSLKNLELTKASNRNWTQKVFQVDDSPRYEGTSKWIYDNKQAYWESTADAPLPRRDNTKRSDYNVLRRRNRNFITDSGWRHEQDNEKIYRTEQLDSTLVYEKGVNIYKKVDDKRCQPAIDWWEINKDFWQIVRNEWDIAFDKKSDLQVQLKSEGKSLIKTMYVLNDEWNQKKKPSKKKWQKKIKSTINNYILQKEI
jgi:hypothetical protein|tara:strand:- start:6302 stop:7249 length:948 start_codon:yes stop_codon:yes gene_type:complete